MKEKVAETSKTLLKQSKQMSMELKKNLAGKTIKDVSCRLAHGDVYIRFLTDKGVVVIGANEMGVWISDEKTFEQDIAT